MIILNRRCRYYHFIVAFICLLFFLNFNFRKNISIKTAQSTVLDCTGDPLIKWCANQIHLCNSSLIIYNKLFVKTDSIILQTKLAKGNRQGGEELINVLNQSENNEYFQFEKGFIQLSCDISFPSDIFKNNHLSKIFSSLTTTSSDTSHQYLHLINETTIAVNRYDYVNFYHTITDLYNVYLVCRFFRLNPRSVHILFLDAHPKGTLDIFWSQLFHSYTRLGQLNVSTIFYKSLIWSPIQSKSELDVKQARILAPSYFFDFRQHILQEFQIHIKSNNKINCQHINIVFLLRGNYIAHPRNPSGKIQRQLINENQILDELKLKFENLSSIYFTFHHFEHLSIEKQLSIITQTDIFLGMHGAGLTHVLFLKSNGILIELSTLEWQQQKHFERMSSMMKINYYRCIIQNGHPNTSETIYNCITKELIRICPYVLDYNPRINLF